MAELDILQSQLPPDLFAAQQQLNRQQQMAQMLMQQNQQPQGQMISGRYVAPSIFQQLQPVANMLAGAYLTNKGDTEAAKLAQQIRQNKSAANQSVLDKYLGTPDQVTEMAGPYAGNVPMPVATKEGQKPDYAGALREIYSPTNYYGAGKELVPSIMEQLKPKKTPEQIKYEAALADGSFKGGFNAFLNQMSDKDKASLAIDKQRLGIAQQELAYNTGIGMPNMGGGQGGGQGGNQFAPATMPQYQYNPSLSPKQNQEAAGKFAETMQKNVTNAKDSFDLMKEASKVLASDVASSGRLSSIGTGIGEFFGADSKASQADAQLNMLSGALTMKQPRFEGPQGVLDVTLYQKLAGDLGNPNIPIQSRLATMQQMVNLQKKYYPGGDWDSIQTKLDNTNKVSVGKPNLVYDPSTGTFK